MEKYVKPIMMLEEIEDEVYTIDGAVAGLISGDADKTVGQTLVPAPRA